MHDCLPLPRSCLLSGLFQRCSRNGSALLLQWYTAFQFSNLTLFSLLSANYFIYIYQINFHAFENIISLNAVGWAFLRWCVFPAESKLTGGSRALGMAALGLKRKAQEVLIWYTEESLMK